MDSHSPVYRQALGSTQASGINVLPAVNEMFRMTGCIDRPRARVIPRYSLTSIGVVLTRLNQILPFANMEM